jgi:hypothetical protein
MVNCKLCLLFYFILFYFFDSPTDQMHWLIFTLDGSDYVVYAKDMLADNKFIWGYLTPKTPLFCPPMSKLNIYFFPYMLALKQWCTLLDSS